MKFLLFGLLLMTSAHAITGKITIDGSSSLFPLTEAVAEEFKSAEPEVKVNIGVSGTGGGFKKFLLSETDINNASRKIKPVEDADAKKNQVNYIAIPVAYDGITIVVNKKNSWLKSITTAELKKIWDTGSTVKTWNEVNPAWPNEPIKLYGPGTASGTFDFFTEAINGKSQQSRTDFVKSEDDNVLVKGIAGDKNSLGFFGFSYFEENMKTLNAVAVDDGKGAIIPSAKTIEDGSYSPLSRQLYLYVNAEAVKRAEVKKFLQFYINQAPKLAKEIKMIPLHAKEYKQSMKLIK